MTEDEMKEILAKYNPEEIAKQICSIQPMPTGMFKQLRDAGKSEEWLKENGYEPVSSMGLMWTKKEDE